MSRGRLAERQKQAERYPTDVTDAEWEMVRSFLPAPPKRGRKPTPELREVLNALQYLARSGGGWRMLPKDFPPWQTFYWWFRRFVRRRVSIRAGPRCSAESDCDAQ
ncbi:transposase [Sphingomonas hankookensis]|uniref:transposase n=1 Tax=Sphingomonas hankookensis TaxID=563996 RepID=UPI003D303070